MATRSPSRRRGSWAATINAWLTPDAPDGITVGRVLIIPSVYLPSVDGALERLAQSYNWEAFGTQTPDQAADIMRDMIDAYYVSTVMTDINGRVQYLPAWDANTAPNGWAWTGDSAQASGGWWGFTNTAQNNEVTFAVQLSKGTWNVRALVMRTNAGGIISWGLDGTDFGTSDTYNGTQQNNVQVGNPSFTVATDGAHILRLKMRTKNASSSAYGLRLSSLRLTQTA